MSECILCDEEGAVRKYFFKDKPICTVDYAGYLEVLLKDIEDNITSDGALDALRKYQLLRTTTLKEIEKKKQLKSDVVRKKEKKADSEDDTFQMRR